MANAFPVISLCVPSISLASKTSQGSSPFPATSATLPITPLGSTRFFTTSLPRALSSYSSPAPSSKAVIDCVKESLGQATNISLRDLLNLNSWVVRDYYRLVSSVNALEPRILVLSDEQLRAKTVEFRLRLSKGENLADIQAEAFAVVREAARRKLGMRHFDVQIIGGAVLHDGCIAEMKTGEGKTLVSTLAAYLNALTGHGVHVVTVNDYLAQRDAEWMGRIHRFLGLSVGLIQSGMTATERRSSYSCDITYSNNSELGFDYLRDNLSGNRAKLVMRWPKPFHFAIVDEVDSVLIDEGRNPLLISGEASKDAERYPVAAKVAELLVQGIHYNVELKDNSVDLTEEGVALAEMVLETNDLWDENDPWARELGVEFTQRQERYALRQGCLKAGNEVDSNHEPSRTKEHPGRSAELQDNSGVVVDRSSTASNKELWGKSGEGWPAVGLKEAGGLGGPRRSAAKGRARVREKKFEGGEAVGGE
ncbi:Protein translocase subunit SECA2, chloroplastic [Dendrobium catenatum]|uniref:chloroplast protein-transporting ATPase n=1 Tax=Dendrobium catenatum TaxID=906689 RepID=A0A2I0XB10_9ASPA|nr:Protein translocase subunit SECA2, chloroplastic [Dendrobium catenatum]